MATSLGIENTNGWTDQQLSGSLESYSNASSTLFAPSLQNSYSAWSMPMESAASATNHVASTHGQLTRIYVPSNCTVGHVDFYFTTTGTTTVFLSGLYSATGAQLAVTAESHAAIINTAITPVAFTTSPTLAGGNFYYLFTTITWSVQPVLAGATYVAGGAGGAIAFGNANLTVASAPSTADYGVQAILPASLTLSGLTGLGTKIWAGLRA